MGNDVASSREPSETDERVRAKMLIYMMHSENRVVGEGRVPRVARDERYSDSTRGHDRRVVVTRGQRNREVLRELVVRVSTNAREKDAHFDRLGSHGSGRFVWEPVNGEASSIRMQEDFTFKLEAVVYGTWLNTVAHRHHIGAERERE